MLKIGFTTKKQEMGFLEDHCDQVVYFKRQNQTSEFFLSFVEQHVDNEIYVPSLVSLSLQLVQLQPALEYLEKEGKYLFFLEHHGAEIASNELYNQQLIYFAKAERDVMSGRSHDMIEEKVRLGLKHGRPAISTKTQEEIYYLYQNQKKSIRQISTLLDISVGTVHKYSAKKID